MEIDIDVDEAVDDGSTLIRVTMSEAGLQIVFNMTWDEAHELRTSLAKAMIAMRFPDAQMPEVSKPPEPPRPETRIMWSASASQERKRKGLQRSPVRADAYGTTRMGI